MQTLALDPRSLSVLIRVMGTVSTLLPHLRVKAVTADSNVGEGAAVKGKRVAESQEAGAAAQPGEGSQVLPEPRQNRSCHGANPWLYGSGLFREASQGRGSEDAPLLLPHVCVLCPCAREEGRWLSGGAVAPG